MRSMSLPRDRVTGSGGADWQKRFADRLGLQLDDGLADWFALPLADGPVSHGEFCDALEPQAVIEGKGDALWPGFMLPDTLPILGNLEGDWVCLRVGADGSAAEFVHWYHGGGDWIPWGTTLAEVIVFDCYRDRLPGTRTSHAISPPRRRDERDSMGVDWALDHLSLEPPSANQSQESVAQQWLERGIAIDAVACELALAALDHPIRQIEPQQASDLQVAWEPDIVAWIFDADRIPSHFVAALEPHWPQGTSVRGQRWSEADAWVRSVRCRRSDLAWADHTAGWCAEREGRFADAIDCYCNALRASTFSDQSIRFRTHWFPESFTKFSAFRLAKLQDHWSSELHNDPYLGIFLAGLDGRTVRSRVSDYWHGEALQAARDGDWAQAYGHHYRRGWDVGVADFAQYGSILADLADAAHRAGMEARATIANIHRDGLR
jgi:hypothetical protein